MENVKHTPGKWQAIGSHESEGFDCYWIKAQPSPALRGFSKEVAAVTGPQGGEAEANARLIASAPELLAETECLAALLTKAIGDIATFLVLAGQESGISPRTAEYVAAVNRADAMIARATQALGEQP